MTTQIHNITIGLSDRTNIKHVIEQIMVNLKTNIETNNEEFIRVATQETKIHAQIEASRFSFRGDLVRGISSRVFGKSKRGEVFIKSDQIQKAIMNEFGVTSPENYRGIPYAVRTTSKLKSWAEQKAPQWVGKPFVIIGKPGTKSHVIAPDPLNKFWRPTIEIMNAKIPDMFGMYLERTIENS